MKKGEDEVKQVRGLLEAVISQNLVVEDRGVGGFVLKRVYGDTGLGPDVVAYTDDASHLGIYVVIDPRGTFDMDVHLVRSACESASCPYFMKF